MASMRDLAQSWLVRLASVIFLAACTCAICGIVCALATLGGVLAAVVGMLVLTTGVAVTALAALALGLTALWVSVVGPITLIVLSDDARARAESQTGVEPRAVSFPEEAPEAEQQAAAQPDSARISSSTGNPLCPSSVASSAATSPQNSPRVLPRSAVAQEHTFDGHEIMSPTTNRKCSDARRTASTGTVPSWPPESLRSLGRSTSAHTRSLSARHRSRNSGATSSAAGSPAWQRSNLPESVEEDVVAGGNRAIHLARLPSSEFQSALDELDEHDDHTGAPADDTHGSWDSILPSGSHLPRIPSSSIEFAQLQPQLAHSSPHRSDRVHGQVRRNNFDTSFLTTDHLRQGSRFLNSSLPELAYLRHEQRSHSYASLSSSSSSRGASTSPDHNTTRDQAGRRAPMMRNAVSQAQLHAPCMRGRSHYMPPDWQQGQTTQGSGVRLMQPAAWMPPSCRVSGGLSTPLSLQPRSWQPVHPSPFTHNNRSCVIFGTNSSAYQDAVIAAGTENQLLTAAGQAVPHVQGYPPPSQLEGIQWIQPPSTSAQKAAAATRATWHVLTAAPEGASPEVPPLTHNQASSALTDTPADAFAISAAVSPSPCAPRSEFLSLPHLNIPSSASAVDAAEQQISQDNSLDPGVPDTHSEPDGSASVASPRPERSSSGSSSIHSAHPRAEQSFSRMSHIKRNSFSFDRMPDIVPVSRPSSETPPSPLSTSSSSITSPRSVAAAPAPDASMLPSDVQDATTSVKRSPLAPCEMDPSQATAPSVAATDASSLAAVPNSMHNDLESTTAFLSSDPVAGTAESMPSLSAGIAASAAAAANAHTADAHHSEGFSDLELGPPQGAAQPFSCHSHAQAGNVDRVYNSESQFEDAADLTDSPPYVRMQQELAQAQGYLAPHPSPAVPASQSVRSAGDKDSPSPRHGTASHGDSTHLSQSPNSKEPPQSSISPRRRSAYMQNAAHSSTSEEACRTTTPSEATGSGPKYPPITFSLASDLKAPSQSTTRSPSLRSSCAHFPLPRGIACTETGLDSASPDTSQSKSAFDSASEHLQSPTESFEQPQAPVCPAIVVPGSASTVASISEELQASPSPKVHCATRLSLQQPSPLNSSPEIQSAAHSTSTSAVSTGPPQLHPMHYSMSCRNLTAPGTANPSAPPSVSPRLSPNLPTLELPSTGAASTPNSADWPGSRGHDTRPSARYSPGSSRSSSPLSASTSAAQSLASSPSGARKSVPSTVPPLPSSAGPSPLLRLPLHLLPPPKVTAGLPDPNAEPHILSPQSSHRFALQAQQAVSDGGSGAGASEPMSASTSAQQEELQNTAVPSDVDVGDTTLTPPEGSGAAHAISQHSVPPLDLAPRERFLEQPVFSQGVQSTRSSSDGSEDAAPLQEGVAAPRIPAIPVRRTSSTPSLSAASAQPIGAACVSEVACGSPLSTSTPSTSSSSSPLRILPADSTAQLPPLPLPSSDVNPCAEATDRPQGSIALESESHDKECLTPHQQSATISSTTSCALKSSSPLQRVHAQSSMHDDNACASGNAPGDNDTTSTSTVLSAALAAAGERLQLQLDEVMQQVPSNAAIDDPLQHTVSHRVPQATTKATPCATPIELSPQRPEHQIPALSSPAPSRIPVSGAPLTPTSAERAARDSLDDSFDDETPTNTSCATESYSPHLGASPQLPLGPMFHAPVPDVYIRSQHSPSAMPEADWEDSPNTQDSSAQALPVPDHLVHSNIAPGPYMGPQLQSTVQEPHDQEQRRTSEVSMVCSDADTIPNDEPHAVAESVEANFTPNASGAAGKAVLPSAPSGGSCSGASGSGNQSISPFWLRAPASQPPHPECKANQSRLDDGNRLSDARSWGLCYVPSQESVAHVSDSGGDISGEDWPASARAPVRHTWHPSDAPGGASAVLEPPLFEPVSSREQQECTDSAQPVTISVPGPTAKQEETRDSELFARSDNCSGVPQGSADTAQKPADQENLSDFPASHDVACAAEKAIAAVRASSAPKRISQGQSEASTPTAGGQGQPVARINDSPGSEDTEWTLNSSAFSISAPLDDMQQPPLVTAGGTQEAPSQTRQEAVTAAAAQSCNESSPRLHTGNTSTDVSPLSLRQMYSVPSVGGSSHASPDQPADTVQEAVTSGGRTSGRPRQPSPSHTSSASTSNMSLKLESQHASNAASAAVPHADHSTDYFRKHAVTAELDDTAPSVLEATNTTASSGENVGQRSSQPPVTSVSPGRARLLRCLSNASEGSASSVMLPSGKTDCLQPPAGHSLLRCISSCSSGPCSARDSTSQAPAPLLPTTPVGLVATDDPHSPPTSGARAVTTPGDSSNNPACSPVPTTDTAGAHSRHKPSDAPPVNPEEQIELQKTHSVTSARNATPEGNTAARPPELSPPSHDLKGAAAAQTAMNPGGLTPAELTGSTLPSETDCRARALSAIANTNEVSRLPSTPQPVSFAPFTAAQKENQATPHIAPRKKVPEAACPGSGSIHAASDMHAGSTPTSSALLHEDVHSPASLQTTPDSSVTVSIQASSVSTGGSSSSAVHVLISPDITRTRVERCLQERSVPSATSSLAKQQTCSSMPPEQHMQEEHTWATASPEFMHAENDTPKQCISHHINEMSSDGDTKSVHSASLSPNAAAAEAISASIEPFASARYTKSPWGDASDRTASMHAPDVSTMQQDSELDVPDMRMERSFSAPAVTPRSNTAAAEDSSSGSEPGVGLHELLSPVSPEVSADVDDETWSGAEHPSPVAAAQGS